MHRSVSFLSFDVICSLKIMYKFSKTDVNREIPIPLFCYN